MDEQGQIEQTEIVETESVTDCALPLESLPLNESITAGSIAEKSDACLMTLSATELALRRSVGQIIDFAIVYGGVIFYFTRSGFVFCNFDRDCIHPLVFNLSRSGNWQFIGLLILLSVPYLYLRWYFKVFKHYFTPGEMIVGLASSRPSLEQGKCSGELKFAVCQLARVVIAVLYAVLALTWAGIPFGLLFICFSGAFASRWKDVMRYGVALVICNALWLALVFWFSSLPENGGMIAVVSWCIFLGLSLWIIFDDNRPAAGKKVQSPVELSHDMQTQALRDIKR